MLLIIRYLLYFSTILLLHQAVQATPVSNHSLMQIQSLSLLASPLHQHEIKDRLQVSAAVLNRLQEGDTVTLPLPDGRKVTAVLQHKALPMTSPLAANKGRKTHNTLHAFSINGSKGAVELMLQNGALHSYEYHDLSGDEPRVFHSDLDASGNGSITEVDAHDYYCIGLPDSALLAAQPSGGIAAILPEEEVPSLSELRTLQGNPLASKVLYINYWGGTLTNTLWNLRYTSNAPIVYEAFNIGGGDAADFTHNERYLMWLGWRETVEDYAPFDINVTTDSAVYNAADVENRGMITATPTYQWVGTRAGGLAYINGFGDSYIDTGWAWNLSEQSLGVTIAHEAGHLMGLHHDGHESKARTTNRGTDYGYYEGHGEWGPIMGSPYKKAYSQWSKGEYPGARQPEDDIAIIAERLGEAADLVGDTAENAYPLSTSTTLVSSITPRSSGEADLDVFSFSLATPDSISIAIAPLLVSREVLYGTNLALQVELYGPSGYVTGFIAPPPHSNTNSAFSYQANLPAGDYTLTVRARISADNAWSTEGFGEYGNGGLYKLSLSSSVAEADLTTALNAEYATAFSGQSLALRSEIRNVGTATAAAGQFSVYQADDATVDPSTDRLIETAALPALPSGAVHYHSTEITLPNSSGAFWYAICAQADANESVIANNCAQTVRIDVAQNSLDLDIADAVDTNQTNPSLVWQRQGAASFYRQTADTFDGEDALRSGVIDHQQRTYLTLELAALETLSFYWKVSSEPNFDFFYFHVDEVEVAKISGEVAWKQFEYTPSDRGSHTYRWAYIKDQATETEEDAGFLDQVELTLTKPEFAITAVDAAKAEGDSGATEFNFQVLNDGHDGAATLNYAVQGHGENAADSGDFSGDRLPSGLINFAEGQTTAAIQVLVQGDEQLEADEGFSVVISAPSSGIINTARALAVIENDESDSDQDGISNQADNCPRTPEHERAAVNAATGCSSSQDSDGDGVPNDGADGKPGTKDDNCPDLANANQNDHNNNTIGDACEANEFCFPVIGENGIAMICLF